MLKLSDKYKKEIIPEMMRKFNYKSVMAVPRVEKVIINSCFGKLISGKFDKIIMPRPQLKETFLKFIWKFAKKNSEIFYYDFGKDINLILKNIEKEAKLGKKKITILEYRKAGEIAPYKFRFLIRFRVS